MYYIIYIYPPVIHRLFSSYQLLATIGTCWHLLIFDHRGFSKAWSSLLAQMAPARSNLYGAVFTTSPNTQ